jgi:tryptophan synthase beta chain
MKQTTTIEMAIPEYFLNLNYYLKKYLNKLPDPHLNPVTRKPVEAKDLEMIFAKELVRQETTLEEKVAIPDEVREIYKKFRLTPLLRADRLEAYLKTKARIYYKYEGATLTGSHKINTALVQAYYNKQEGIETLTTETGAGQWGSALALACKMFDLKCKVFMVRSSYEHKPYRKYVMQAYGAEIHASPSEITDFGQGILIENPQHPGSLGIAISEALEMAAKGKSTKYALGSVLNHVLLHQTVIGQEVKTQLKTLGEYPDLVIGCVGGGSNFVGFAAPFIIDKISGKNIKTRIIGVEAAACPKMTKGVYRYDFGDTAQKTPLLKMQTLGSDFVPDAIHAGGLRYHGNAPILSFLNEEKITEARAYQQKEIFEAGLIFARTEGILPAPESNHAIKAAIDEAKNCRKEKVIVLNLSGHGLLDMQGYSDYLSGKLDQFH